jgi:hypothetical protein
MTERRRQVQDSQDYTFSIDRTASSILPGQGWQERISIIGKLEQDNYERPHSGDSLVETGQSGQDSHNMTARTEQIEQDNLKRTGLSLYHTKTTKICQLNRSATLHKTSVFCQAPVNCTYSILTPCLNSTFYNHSFFLTIRN